MSRIQCLRSLISGVVRVSTGSAPAAALLRQSVPLQLSFGAAKIIQASSFRYFSASSVVQNELLRVLKEEHKYELDNYQKPEQIVSGPPAPFVLTEIPGDTLLTLTRKYNGEDISVDLHVNNQPASEVEEEGSALVSFNVSVVKGDKALVFECESDGNDIEILHVSHEPKDGVAQESVFTGPVFEELDETLQNDFKLYLSARGVNADLGEYLRFLIFDKEQREYTAWLKNVADFVSK